MSKIPAGNRMARSLAPIERVPGALRSPVRSLAIGRMVPFVGTAGLLIEELTTERAVVSIRNRRKVQNHIGGVHAAAMALIAETATGFVVGMNLPDDKLPLVRSMRVEYKRRAEGGLRAEATLPEEARARMQTDDKGDVTVPVRVVDDSGAEPIVCELVWAWTRRKK